MPVEDAVGLRIKELPITSEKIFAALNAEVGLKKASKLWSLARRLSIRVWEKV